MKKMTDSLTAQIADQAQRAKEVEMEGQKLELELTRQ